MDKMQNLKTVAQFRRLGNAVACETHITQIQSGKHAYAQPISIAEYKANGQPKSADFSISSLTVDVSSR